MKNNQALALVTGSSRGIGFAIAQELDARKVSTILTGRSSSKLEEALQQLVHANHSSRAIDFSNEKQLDDFLDQLIANHTVPNIIIHNLGGTVPNDGFPLNLKSVRAALNLNLESAIQINEKLLPYLIAQKISSRIIHISSDASLTGRASPSYVIAKAALNGYIKSASRYYAKHNIMICAVLPGIIEHEGSAWARKKMEQPELYQSKLQQTTLGRFGLPQEVATFVSDLALSENMLCAGGLYECLGAI